MPSSHAPSLALICPSFSEAFMRHPLRLPAMERLVAYADAPVAAASSSRAVDTWQCELLKAVGLNDFNQYPSAPLTWMGTGHAVEAATWLHAEPMVQSISAHGLAMTSAQWSAVTLAAVEELVRDHLTAAQMQWRVANGRAYLQINAPTDVRTVTARQAQLSELQEALPTGPGAIIVRRAMNELQMLLHEKLNDSAAPNAIWLWGAGTMPHLPTKALPPMWTNDDYARGIYRAHAASESCAPLSTLDAMLVHSGAGLIRSQDSDAPTLTLPRRPREGKEPQRDFSGSLPCESGGGISRASCAPFHLHILCGRLGWGHPSAANYDLNEENKFSLNSGDGRLCAVVREHSLTALEEQWFAPALRALDQGRLQSVDLYLDGWQVHAKRSLMRRLFARSRPITEWMN